MAQNRASDELFKSAKWYDLSIDWDARLAREIPVLVELFGPPGTGGLLDAGCGTGRQAHAMSQRGYRVVGIDASGEMLEIARRHGGAVRSNAEFVRASFAEAVTAAGHGFDGVYCIGNSLAATGTARDAHAAVDRFAGSLRPGGRLFVQILNFEPMRGEDPCVRGPRVTRVEGRTYVSIRHFTFSGDAVTVTNVTLFEDAGWKQRAHAGTLYPIRMDELQRWCDEAGVTVDTAWGGYDRRPFNIETSVDLIIAGTKT